MAPNQTAARESPSRRRNSHIPTPPTSSLAMAAASSASAVGSSSAGSVNGEKVALWNDARNGWPPKSAALQSGSEPARRLRAVCARNG